MQRIEKADGIVDRLSAVILTPNNPEQLTADILRRVRTTAVTLRPQNPIDRILDFFLLPVVRYSATALVLLATGTFMTQLFTTMNSISNLERRMASPVGTNAREVTYSMRSKTLQEVASSQQGQALKDNLALTVSNDRIDVSAKKVDSFLSGQQLNDISAALGSSVLGVDKKTVEKIVNEIKATAESTFRFRPEGA